MKYNKLFYHGNTESDEDNCLNHFLVFTSNVFISMDDPTFIRIGFNCDVKFRSRHAFVTLRKTR